MSIRTETAVLLAPPEKMYIYIYIYINVYYIIIYINIVPGLSLSC